MQLRLVDLLKLLIPTQIKNNATEVAFYVLISHSFTLWFNYNNHTQMFKKKQKTQGADKACYVPASSNNCTQINIKRKQTRECQKHLSHVAAGSPSVFPGLLICLLLASVNFQIEYSHGILLSHLLDAVKSTVVRFIYVSICMCVCIYIHTLIYRYICIYVFMCLLEHI